MNYKYVVGGSTSDFYVVSNKDLENLKDVKYIVGNIEFKNKFTRFLYRFHHSMKLNKIINLPFKSLWNKYYLNNEFDKNDKICFLVNSSVLKLQKSGMLTYLRQQYKNCKIVLFFTDLFEYENRFYSIDEIKSLFDLVLSFDQGDCEKYGFTYYPLVYSFTEVEDNPNIKESDVYFVGKAKDRYDEIISAYEKFKNAGLVCDFNIVNAKKQDRKYDGEINYISQMDYKTNLEHIKKTRCMLEIMQGGGRGYTLRYCEAIAHDRRLITNNPEIKYAPFYNEKLISVFEKIDDIDVDFVKNGEKDVDYHFKDELSPKKLLLFIDKIL